MLFIALFVLSAFFNVMGLIRSLVPGGHGNTERTRTLEETVIEHTNSDNKLAVITVDGVISSGEVDRSGMSLQEFVKEQLKAAEADKDVKAVILKVDSPGGEVLASDEINMELRKFQDRSHKPVVVSMGTLAASGGYYISAPARWIVANDLTITGSIGVIMHGYNYRKLMDKIGLRPHVYKSGKFKDMLSGEREPDDVSPEDEKTRAEEDAMVQALIDETYNKFKSVVQSGRDAAAKANAGEGKSLVPNWTEYADGRILSGHQALERGFVDELGDFDTAVNRAEKLTSISSANLIEYHVPVDLGAVLSHVLGKSEAPALKVDLGWDMPKLQIGRLYFMAPTTLPH
ncbi:MAG TPA: signal peptide peptidase SppA [Verrucomicrobiae bacterium]|nr:signal peptide peptidase SppA [Verrucomicrobiae bacterium]